MASPEEEMTAPLEQWRDYAGRWGTDQYDEGYWSPSQDAVSPPRRGTVVDCMFLVMMVCSGLTRIWLELMRVGVLDR